MVGVHRFTSGRTSCPSSMKDTDGRWGVRSQSTTFLCEKCDRPLDSSFISTPNGIHKLTEPLEKGVTGCVYSLSLCCLIYTPRTTTQASLSFRGQFDCLSFYNHKDGYFWQICGKLGLWSYSLFGSLSVHVFLCRKCTRPKKLTCYNTPGE